MSDSPSRTYRPPEPELGHCVYCRRSYHLPRGNPGALLARPGVCGPCAAGPDHPLHPLHDEPAARAYRIGGRMNRQ